MSQRIWGVGVGSEKTDASSCARVGGRSGSVFFQVGWMLHAYERPGVVPRRMAKVSVRPSGPSNTQRTASGWMRLWARVSQRRADGFVPLASACPKIRRTVGVGDMLANAFLASGAGDGSWNPLEMCRRVQRSEAASNAGPSILSGGMPPRRDLAAATQDSVGSAGVGADWPTVPVMEGGRCAQLQVPMRSMMR